MYQYDLKNTYKYYLSAIYTENKFVKYHINLIYLCKSCANIPYLYLMNTNIVVSLDTRRKKSDGTFPIIMRLGHNSRTIPIATGISIKETDWDEQGRKVKKSYTGVSNVTHLNNLIQKKKSDALDIIMKLHDSGNLDILSVADLKDRICSPSASQSFFEFTNQLIEELKKSKQFGTARSYKGVASVLKEFCNNKDLSFKSINYQFLSRLETSHLAKGNTLNGLSVYMRAIRAIYNKAIKSGLVDKELYPFEAYKIKSAPTEKRALEWDLLKEIINSKITPDHQCFNARNYFVASYMMYGMNFKDMAFLKKSDIKDGRIQYQRKKTSKYYDIKITSNLDKILTYYSELSAYTEYIFPIINRQNPELQDRDIQWARKRYNKKLKLLAKECGIEKNLTSYVSRHSFATQAMLQDVPLNAISSMLGHSSIKTTEIYLKSLPSKILDDYNLRILQQ